MEAAVDTLKAQVQELHRRLKSVEEDFEGHNKDVHGDEDWPREINEKIRKVENQSHNTGGGEYRKMKDRAR